MQKFDPALLEQIKSLVPISRLVGEYVAADAGKSSAADLWACCPFHGERTPSFHAEDAKGIYHCFGCGATGDHFQWMQEHQGMTFPQAVEAVADRAGVTLPGNSVVAKSSITALRARYEAPVIVDPYEGYEFIPVPAGTPPIVPGQRTPELRNPKKASTDKFTTHYKPSAVYAYENADGLLLGYVLRVDFKDGKSTPGIWWARGPDGFEGWCHGSLENAPLYGLTALLAAPDKQVLVVEGEKCADAAREALQGRVVVISWCGGVDRAKNADWSPLAGRSVIWWQDDDDGGHAAMFSGWIKQKTGKPRWLDGVIHNVKARTHKAVKPYRKPDIEVEGEMVHDKGGDVADLILAGGSVADYIKANISEWNKERDDGNNHSSVGDGSSVSGVLGEAPNEPDGENGKRNRSDKKPSSTLNSSVGGLNDTHTDHGPSPLPSPEPSAAPQDHKPGTQSLGGSGREAVAAEQNPDWQDQLDRTDKGTLTLNSLHNAMMVLQYHQDFEGIYAYNEFAQEIAITRRPPWDPPRRPFKPRLLTEIDIIANTGYMETLGDFKLKPKVQDMVAAIKRVADFNRFNPVIDALEKLEWDGMPRLMGGAVGKRTFNSFAVRYLGAEDTPINAAFVARTLIGAVARVYEPGKKHDTMLVLEGTQGSGKSTSIKILANAIAPDLFTDELSEPGTKDAGLQLQGRWIIEVSELDAFRKSDVATLKAFIAREIDRFRRPYGKFVEAFPRSCIMIGTVNPPESGYLRDPSGARRWWPIRCGEFDLDLLKEDALQVWAEARHMYLQGAHTYLTDEEEEQARIVQQARYEHDPWASMIDDYLSRQDGLKTTVSILELMGPSCINVHNERRTPTHAARIAAHLNMIGWKQIDRGIYRRPLTH